MVGIVKLLENGKRKYLEDENASQGLTKHPKRLSTEVLEFEVLVYEISER